MKYCVIPEMSALNYLPGPYTLIVKKNDGAPLSSAVNPGNDTVGVRIPDNWFSDLIEEAGVPFVTTSVNISGELHMQSVDDIPTALLNQVDYLVYEGPIVGKSSVKINLTASSTKPE
jgi:tRNA A37 threonylcarbamoyladenosine synthetase subunit TsaC/SUA5/YrdC